MTVAGADVWRVAPAAALPFLLLAAGCGETKSGRYQGYVEGEFVYVASPRAGALTRLYVQRGDQVEVGDPLFSLEDEPESQLREEAARRLAQAQASLEDAKKGKRPSEISSLEAQLSQARAALTLAEKEFMRQEKLSQSAGATTQQELDRARSSREQANQRVLQLEADLKTAKLGSREDQITAAEAQVRMQEAALAKAEWDLSEKSQFARQAGLVFDTLYREGEWVAAGKPAVVLLPPANIKVRAFVPQTEVGQIQAGDSVRVFVDGADQPVQGRVSYISPQAEFTPPVIYSRESRSKLVFMIEAVFAPEDAKNLHPGQPVDVEFK